MSLGFRPSRAPGRSRSSRAWSRFLASVVARIPAGRVASTADVAAAVLYLASPAAGMVTGTVLTVDGGWTAQ
ncbi:MAG: SDR family oxidoreductase [Candidatus Limnocylindrales bacterium]